MLTKKQILNVLTKNQVILKGHFLLSSGLHSDTYFEKFEILKNPKLTRRFSREIARRMKNKKIDVVLGLATGGIILGYELASLLKTRAIFTERFEGKMSLRRNFRVKKGERVLIAEDVITTGGSVKETLAIVEREGGKVVCIACLVDRSGGRVSLGYPLLPVISLDVRAYSRGDCPLCRQNLPLRLLGSNLGAGEDKSRS